MHIRKNREVKAREQCGNRRGHVSRKKKMDIVIWIYRVLLTSSSLSWYHSRAGGGTAVNWQWNTASSFLITTWSSGVTTGRGKLLSIKGVDKHLHDYIYRHETIKRNRICALIKKCQQQCGPSGAGMCQHLRGPQVVFIRALDFSLILDSSKPLFGYGSWNT